MEVLALPDVLVILLVSVIICYTEVKGLVCALLFWKTLVCPRTRTAHPHSFTGTQKEKLTSSMP